MHITGLVGLCECILFQSFQSGPFSVRWGLCKHPLGWLPFNCSNIWKAVTYLPASTKWLDPHYSVELQMCNPTSFYSNLTKALTQQRGNKVHVHSIATQSEGGVKCHWGGGNGFSLTDESGSTRGCPGGKHTTLSQLCTFISIICTRRLVRRLIWGHIFRLPEALWRLVASFIPHMTNVIRCPDKNITHRTNNKSKRR